MRQVRLALDREMQRVQRVLLADDGCCDLAALHDAHPDLIVARRGAAASLTALLPEADSERGASLSHRPARQRHDVLPARCAAEGTAHRHEAAADAVADRLMAPAQRLLWFRRAALAGALLAALVVVLGAWVRLTDAGLGCPDWPGCYGHPYPQAAQGFAKAWHEMIHRYFAGGLVTVTTLLLVLALANRRLPAQPLLPVVLLFVLIFAQAALGALTVTELLEAPDRDVAPAGWPIDAGAALVAGVATPAITAGTRGCAACAGAAGRRRARRAALPRRLDQHQLRGGGLPGSAHLPAVLVAGHGLPGRLCLMAWTRHRLHRRRAEQSRHAPPSI